MSDHLKSLSQVYLEQIAESAEKVNVKYDPHMDLMAPQVEEEEVELDENRRAARAAGGYKDDSKKQPDPSKDGFTGIGNMSIDQIRKMSARIERDKKKTKSEEVEHIDEAPYQIYGSSDGKKKEKKIGKPVKSKSYADARASELENTHTSSGGKYGMKTTRVQYTETLDPVGKEDADVDNDGKKNDSNDKYIMSVVRQFVRR